VREMPNRRIAADLHVLIYIGRLMKEVWSAGGRGL
jgi:hypothetical protein